MPVQTYDVFVILQEPWRNPATKELVDATNEQDCALATRAAREIGTLSATKFEQIACRNSIGIESAPSTLSVNDWLGLGAPLHNSGSHSTSDVIRILADWTLASSIVQQYRLDGVLPSHFESCRIASQAFRLYASEGCSGQGCLQFHYLTEEVCPPLDDSRPRRWADLLGGLAAGLENDKRWLSVLSQESQRQFGVGSVWSWWIPWENLSLRRQLHAIPFSPSGVLAPPTVLEDGPSLLPSHVDNVFGTCHQAGEENGWMLILHHSLDGAVVEAEPTYQVGIDRDQAICVADGLVGIPSSRSLDHWGEALFLLIEEETLSVP